MEATFTELLAVEMLPVYAGILVLIVLVFRAKKSRSDKNTSKDKEEK